MSKFFYICAGSLFAWSAMSAQADNGKMYDVCSADEDAVTVAYELRAIDEGSVAEDGLAINRLYAEGKCESRKLDFTTVNATYVTGLTPQDGSRYVVLDIGSGFAVVEESIGEPMDDTPLDSVISSADGKSDLPTGVALAIAANVVCGTAVVQETSLVIDDGACQ